MNPQPDAPALQLRRVSVRLGKQQVVSDVDMTVARGEWVTLAGPNGAGKSTLLRACGGLVPFDGEVELAGQPLTQLSHRRRALLVSYLPQQPVLPPGMTVAEYVLLGRTPHLRPLGVESAADLEVCTQVTGQLDLAGLLGRQLSTLSGGELQRAHLARALAQQAPLVLADELTTGLDIGHEQQALELIDTFRRSAGLTVLAAMHDLNAAAQYSDRMVLVDGGKVVADGSPAEVLRPEVLADLYGARVQVSTHAGQLAVVPVRGQPADGR